MDIQPVDPPGRPNRKLRAHLDVVKRLHEQGYSIGAIRKAFCEAGVVIGWSTVQREVARLSRVPTTTPPAAPETEHVTAPTPSPKRVDVAEFFASAVDNPLIKRKQAAAQTEATPKIIDRAGIEAFFKAHEAQDPMLLRVMKKNNPP